MKIINQHGKLENWQEGDYEVTFTFADYKIIIAVTGTSGMNAMAKAILKLPIDQSLENCLEIEPYLYQVFNRTPPTVNK